MSDHESKSGDGGNLRSNGEPCLARWVLTVVDTGPYESIRHPLYLATTSALLGTGAVLGNWVSIATAGLPTAALVRRIAVEESMLESHLGSRYVTYQARTKRLVPGI